MFKILSGRLSATFNLDGNHLERYLERRGHLLSSLCEDLILHDQVLIPTQDYLTASGLILILGERNFSSLLESNQIRFLRTRGVFGYVRGTGRDGSLVAFEDPDRKRPQDSDIDASVHAGLSVVADRIKDHKHLTELLIRQSDCFEMAQLVDSVRQDSYRDLKQTSLWRNGYLYPHRDLLSLPKMEKMQVRVLGPNTDIENNVVDLLLALSLFNMELQLSVENECVSNSTASPLGDSIDIKLKRLTEITVPSENFWSLLTINRVPDFAQIDTSDTHLFEKLTKKLDGSNAVEFRRWFHQNKNLSEKEFIAEYLDVLNNTPWIQKLPAKVVRFAITLALDLVPVAGKVASVLDTFVVERLLRGKSPKYFIEDLKKFRGTIKTK